MRGGVAGAVCVPRPSRSPRRPTRSSGVVLHGRPPTQHSSVPSAATTRIGAAVERAAGFPPRGRLVDRRGCRGRRCRDLGDRRGVAQSWNRGRVRGDCRSRDSPAAGKPHGAGRSRHVGGTDVPRSADAAPGSATAATVSGATIPAAPGPGSVASVLGTTAPVPARRHWARGDPAGAIPCGNAYIVQVASELDQPAFAARVSAVQSANQLPPGAKWTQTSDSCAIFTSQVNALVLYSGPYTSPYDACPARLASPPDAFIKGTTPATSSTYVSCLCPAEASSLPAIRTVGEQGVWIGELQRVLGSRLDYNVGSVNADPSVGDPGHWGTYMAETAAAVGRFQADAGLPVTSQVDAATWVVLRGQSC